MSARVLVFAARPGDRYRVGRTLRALDQAGFAAVDGRGLSVQDLSRALLAAAGPVWLLRAGAWPAAASPIRLPPASATGRPLCALGRVCPDPDGGALSQDEVARWDALLHETGGDFSHTASDGCLPDPASVYLEAAAATALARKLAQGEELSAAALRGELGGGTFRVVHYPPLDVHDDPGLRVVQVVTSLQIGGAERITLDLREELSRLGVSSRIIVLGSPTRTGFAVPPGTVDLSCLGGDRQERRERLVRLARAWGCDLVHGHLLDREDAAGIAALGLPLVLTVHNVRPGWPHGLGAMRPQEATLLIACARAVEPDLDAAKMPIPIRTVWNGVNFGDYERTPARLAEAAKLRRRWRFGPGDFVLLALANPRPQKRLHLLPAILAATRKEMSRRGSDREARLVFAGEASARNAEAVAAAARVRAEVKRLGLRRHVVSLPHAVRDVAGLLAACDVLVSASAYEGLSLAHLEALAADLPVVATETGGTAELARNNPAVFVLPCAAEPQQFASILADVACRPPESGRKAAAVHFTRQRLAERYRWLYPRAVERAWGPHQGEGLWLVTNNFSTGGAQSSARRLLLGLAAEGVRVRAAVLEEQPDHPTPGRRALTAAGVPVLALPLLRSVDAAAAVGDLLERIDADPPAAVLLWNALAEYKLLLADALLDTPLYDVSPGEMYFASLERYFARPRPALPYRDAAEYGARLAGVIVKYQAEAARAAATLGAPVHVIPNGVPLSPAASPAPRSDGVLVLGTAARIHPQKKLEELLSAVRQAHDRLPPYVLRIAGGVERGCEEYAVTLRSRAKGLPVEWLGEVHDLASFLHDLDVFVLVAEPAGCPNASLEAMAAGLPVVATDVGGIAEQVEDGVTGRVAPRGDSAALAAALVELAAEPGLRGRWGAAARRRVGERFGLERMVAAYRRVCLG
jgi:glycosyltransferase involved in cell wall biosynthesis